MSITISVMDQAKALNGLNTYVHTAKQNSMYTVECDTSIQPNSGVSVSIVQAGSASVTVSAPAPVPSQINIPLKAILNCQIGDTITITISSSTVSDEQLNAVKTFLKITPGTV